MLRRASLKIPDLRPKFDPKLGRRRAPTPAFLLRQNKETGEWEKTLSVDLEEALLNAGLSPKAHINSEEYLARCIAADVRGLGFGVIADPIPGNDQHGGITGIDPKQREQAARKLARLSTIVD